MIGPQLKRFKAEAPIRRFNVNCLEGVLSCLDDDSLSLYACTLVSRTWFKSAVRFLWRDPCRLSKPDHRPSSRLIDTMLQCLVSVDERRMLHKMGLRLNGEIPPLDYLAFVRFLPICKMLQALYGRLLRGNLTFGKRIMRFIRYNIGGRASVGDITEAHQDETLRQARLLFGLMVAHCHHIAHVSVSEHFLLSNKPRIVDISPVIDKNILRRVTEFTLSSVENRDALLVEVANTTTSLRTIRFTFDSRTLQLERMATVFGGLINLIKAQRRLKHVYIRGYHVDGFSIMEALRMQADWLETVEFMHVNMTKKNPQFHEGATFPYCPNLKRLGFRSAAVDVPNMFSEFFMEKRRVPLRHIDFSGAHISPNAILPLLAASSDNIEVALLGVSGGDLHSDNSLLHGLSRRCQQLKHIEVHGINFHGKVIRLLTKAVNIESLVLLPWRGFKGHLSDDFRELANREVVLWRLNRMLIDDHVVDIKAFSRFVARCAPGLREFCVNAVGFAGCRNRPPELGLNAYKYDRATIQYNTTTCRMDVTYYKNDHWGQEHPSISLTSFGFTKDFQLAAAELLQCLRIETLRVRYEAAAPLPDGL